jgi:protease YdgD
MKMKFVGGVLWALALFLTVVPAEALDMIERRRMLSAEEHFAWRGVGRVNIATFRERGMCTGTLIAEDLVLTAAHCLVSNATGKPYAPGNIHFVAGWRQGVMVASSRAASVALHPLYRHNAPPDLEQIGADLALIRLARPIPSGDVPSFKVAPAPAGRPALTLISYRQDRANALTRQEGCVLRGADRHVMALGCDVTFGASGSPLFAEIGGERRLIAVISAMSEAQGIPIAWAVRVDEAIGQVLMTLE